MTARQCQQTDFPHHGVRPYGSGSTWLVGLIRQTIMIIWSQRIMKALARDFSIRHPGESRGPSRVSRDWIPASAGMTKQRIPRRDFQAKYNKLNDRLPET